MIGIRQLPEPYSQQRRFAVVWNDFTHLAYGATAQEAFANFVRIFKLDK